MGRSLYPYWLKPNQNIIMKFVHRMPHSKRFKEMNLLKCTFIAPVFYLNLIFFYVKVIYNLIVHQFFRGRNHLSLKVKTRITVVENTYAPTL